MKTAVNEAKKETISTLKQKVGQLEAELEKCLDVEAVRVFTDDKRDEMFSNTCCDIEEALLGVLRVNDSGDYVTWSGLRDRLQSDSRVRHMFGDDNFIHGVMLVSMLAERFHVLFHLSSEEQEHHRDHTYGAMDPDDDTPFYYRYSQSIPRIVLGSLSGSDEEQDFTVVKNYNAFIKVREGFGIVQDAFDDGDFTQLRFELDAIIWLLRYLISTYKLEK